jgi:hypothetical protein
MAQIGVVLTRPGTTKTPSCAARNERAGSAESDNAMPNRTDPHNPTGNPTAPTENSGPLLLASIRNASTTNRHLDQYGRIETTGGGRSLRQRCCGKDDGSLVEAPITADMDSIGATSAPPPVQPPENPRRFRPGRWYNTTQAARPRGRGEVIARPSPGVRAAFAGSNRPSSGATT